MNTRPLEASETAVLERFRLVADDYALLFLTRTGLEKSILDATAAVRTLLETDGYHDFVKQPQGKEHKVVRETVFLLPGQVELVPTSLYRPITKKGDPRIWFSGLGHFSNAGDVLGLFFYQAKLHAINLSQVARLGGISRCPKVAEWLTAASAVTNAVAAELLELLKRLASNGPLKAVGHGDTAIGRTLETALNIRMNSSRAPDFKGIEVKSARQRKNRHQLFAQVPDWELSRCKSMDDILRLVGYERNGRLQLNCTVSTRKANGQGLQFRFVSAVEQLVEFACEHGDIAIWRLQKLHERLLEKHRETFWVHAESEFIEEVEWFHFVRVTHTSVPSVSQFDALLKSGGITMDHQMKLVGTRAHERGPSFKLRHGSLDDLFVAKNRHYDLR